ncbi:MAG: B12-binding domain-containing radical SAM protein [Pseudomonadota bacterium]
MNALLVYPEFPDTFWSFKHALNFIQKRASLPPLGLLTLGAMLPKEWDKRLVDTNVTRLKKRDLDWADIVFIGGMVVQRDSSHKIIAQCKEAGLKVVAGGPLFTSEYEDFPDVDHFVLNEAELTLPLFLADLKSNCAKRVYKTQEVCDIRKTTAPMWELANFKRYASMSIQFCRGCPFDCEFCNVTALFGRQPRIKTAVQIITELDSLYNLGWRGQIFFVDDNFIGNKKYVKDVLLPALIEWRKDKKGMPFYTEASINLADDEELMKMMVEAGFDTVFIGIETPDEKGLAECNKKQNKNRDLIDSVRRIQRIGLQVQGGFIVGFDSDTQSIFQKQIDFIQESGIVTAMVGMLQAPAGTKLYKRLKAEGRLIGHMSGNNADGTTNIIPNMGFDALQKGYKNLIGQIYSHKRYYQRVKVFLQNYEPPKIEQPLTFQRLLAFFRSNIRLGIIGRQRFHYWKLLLWTLVRRPQLFPMAITLSIYGHHFDKICRLYIL